MPRQIARAENKIVSKNMSQIGTVGMTGFSFYNVFITLWWLA
jgi:hypothetical protein